MAKRGNSEGSIRHRPDGLWEARVTLPTGGRKSVYAKTRSECTEKLDALRRSVADGLPVPSDRLTVAAYLTDWLATVVGPSVRPATLEAYTHHVERIIIPALGRVLLRSLEPAQVQRMINQVAVTRGSVAATRCRSTLRTALNHAMHWGMASRNAAALAKPPKMVKPDLAILPPEQARAFIAAVQDDKHAALWCLALGAGLRRGECLGLRWQDVDLDAGRINVRYSLQRQARAWVLVEPKSAESRRSIRAPEFVLGALRRHRVRAAELALAAGIPLPELVFTGQKRHGPLDSSWVNHRLTELLGQLGFPPVRFHALRHSCATLLMSLGVHPRVVQEILGHSHVSMTLATYSHVVETMQEDAMAKVDAFLSSEKAGRGMDGVETVQRNAK